MTAAVAQRQADMMQVPCLRDLWISRPRLSRPPGQDLAIAALAIENQLPIATNDCGDFLKINEHFPLPGVFTPAVQAWIIPRAMKSRLRRGSLTPAPAAELVIS
jgi:toxin FitB